MPERPLYRDARGDIPMRLFEAHAGLWYERFFDRYEHDAEGSLRVPDGAKRRGDGTKEKNEKLRWISTVTGRKIGERDRLAAQASRLDGLAHSLGGASRVFAGDWHFVTGLGNPHPVENGFTWHPTLGVPYLPGSAVKGMLRSYIDVWREDLGARIPEWFGGAEKQVPAEGAGNLIFFDALPVERPMLAADVMTPHMGDWYAKGADEPGKPKTIPGDWHDPVPVPFLVAKHIKLLFGVAPRRRGYEMGSVLDVLEEALTIIGAGAKTAMGYGLMTRDSSSEQGIERQRRELDERRRKAAQNRAAARRAAELEALPPSQSALARITELLDEHIANDTVPGDNGELMQQLNKALDEAGSGAWPLDDARRLIELAPRAWQLAGRELKGKRLRKIQAIESHLDNT